MLWEEGTVRFEAKYHANGWRNALFDSHLIARLSKAQETEREGVFTLLCLHCHLSLRATRPRTHLHSKETFVDATWHDEVSKTNNGALSGLIVWLATVRSATKRWEEGIVCFEVKYHANGWKTDSLTLIYYWLRPGAKVTWPLKPNRRERTKLDWKYSQGTSLQMVYNLQV